MNAIIGGAPGTGSSVLVRTIGRHSKIIAGPETFLFMHPGLYQNFNALKSNIHKASKWPRLKSIGWYRLNGCLVYADFYGWTPNALKKMLGEVTSFPTFVERYFEKAIQENEANFWLEKSPSNVIGFNHFLKTFPGAKVIHTTRNPYDNIASLMARGYSSFYAIAAVLLNHSFGLRAVDSERYTFIKYEDLVVDPKNQINQLLKFLDLEPESRIFDAEESSTVVGMEGWSFSETKPIQENKKSRFDQLKLNQKVEVLDLASRMRIRKNYALKHQIKHQTLSDICATFGYEEKMPIGRSKYDFFMDQIDDWWKRSFRLYPTGWFNYPIRLQNYE